MNFTDEQIEEAARILCEMRGKRPDDVTDFSTVRINECFVPERWLDYYRREILHRLMPTDIESALRQTVERKPNAN